MEVVNDYIFVLIVDFYLFFGVSFMAIGKVVNNVL